MFDRKTMHAARRKPLKELLKITTPQDLLTMEKRPVLLHEIEEACAFEKKRFESICLTLIHSFINHSQQLPETANAYYSQPGGMLDNALNRTEVALTLFRSQLVVGQSGQFTEEQSLWQYALFSASLLQGIGKLQVDYDIFNYDSNGQTLKKWNPLLENLVTHGSYYDYEFRKEPDKAFRCRLNLLLARLLMPASGFAWIASNEEVLNIWLALLNEDYYSAGVLGIILIRANAISIQRYLDQFLLTKHAGSRGRQFGRIGTFSGGPESVDNIEQQITIEFLNWMQKGFADGVIMINQAPLLAVPGGLLMSVDIFKLFAREHPEFKNWQAVQSAFMNSELGTKMSADEVLFKQVELALPSTVQVFNVNNGKRGVISALEAIHQWSLPDSLSKQNHLRFKEEPTLPVLGGSGHWFRAQENSASHALNDIFNPISPKLPKA